MTPGDWTEEIREETTQQSELSEVDDQSGSNNQTEPTVAVIKSECDSCAYANIQSYHSDSCPSPIICIDDEWRCSGCGVHISPEQHCPDCGSDLSYTAIETPLDVSHTADPKEIEMAIHQETNKRRAKHNLDTLDYSPHLSTIALQHSRDMAHEDFFDHTDPSGSDASDRYRIYDHDTRSVGENIALTHPLPTVSANEVANSVVEDWMDSPGHRENILRDQFDKEGIGVYFMEDGSMYSTQNFY